MISETRRRGENQPNLPDPSQKSTISGIVRAPLCLTLRARKTHSKTSPQAPLPSHQKAGVPACQARPAMPRVAEPPTQEAAMEIPTSQGPLLRELTKKESIAPPRLSRMASHTPMPSRRIA